jgi:hypothetical protein
MQQNHGCMHLLRIQHAIAFAKKLSTTGSIVYQTGGIKLVLNRTTLSALFAQRDSEMSSCL